MLRTGIASALISASVPSKVLVVCTKRGIFFDALISALAIPVLSMLHQDASNMPAVFIMLALMLWNWLVTAHIIRHALNKSFSFALGIAFLYVFFASI
jgi:hypothetical protein